MAFGLKLRIFSLRECGSLGGSPLRRGPRDKGQSGACSQQPVGLGNPATVLCVKRTLP